VDLLAWSPGAIDTAAGALRSGAPIVTDVNMVRAGISPARVARFANPVHCGIADPAIAEQARSRGLTRSIVAVEQAVRTYPEAVYAFGNAPTALFRLLELVDAGQARPAAVVGVVVGFVGAAESKQELMARPAPPWVSCRGNKGGSNVAAAIVNALLKVAAGEV
jgi:precorrin-8X/cobalt-precorrin-8 methylmutase